MTTYSMHAEYAEKICDRIMAGESLKKICSDPDMPSMAAVIQWLNRDEKFRKQYQDARAAAAEIMADEILEIADDGRNDFMEVADQSGSVQYRLDAEHINRSKLRVETRLKLLAKMNPDRWGDKTRTEVTGKDGAPIEVSDSKRLELIERIMARLAMKAEPPAEAAAPRALPAPGEG